jgi:hypothetical protein
MDFHPPSTERRRSRTLASRSPRPSADQGGEPAAKIAPADADFDKRPPMITSEHIRACRDKGWFVLEDALASDSLEVLRRECQRFMDVDHGLISLAQSEIIVPMIPKLASGA